MALPGRAAPDLTGERYGRLVVEGLTKRPEGLRTPGTYWLCRCDCGKQTVVSSYYLRQTLYPNCGCRQRKIHERQRMIGKGIMPTVINEEKQKEERRKALEGLRKCVNEKICSQCKKPFDCYAGASWAYKMQRYTRKYIFCGYGCMRKFEREHHERHHIDHGQ